MNRAVLKMAPLTTTAAVRCQRSTRLGTMARRVAVLNAAKMPSSNVGVMTTVGKRSANASNPSQVPDWVNSQVSQPSAMRCVQPPTSERAAPSVKIS